jgi:hypothetical protein
MLEPIGSIIGPDDRLLVFKSLEVNIIFKEGFGPLLLEIGVVEMARQFAARNPQYPRRLPLIAAALFIDMLDVPRQRRREGKISAGTGPGFRRSRSSRAWSRRTPRSIP